MISKELFAKVRKLEIKTKGLVNNLFGGEYHSAFKGRGMTFSEVRPYQYGDDYRQIDWNVTARSDEPYIKIFEEEREQTLMLLVDISTSGVFGSQNRRKVDLATEMCAVLAFSAIKNNDKVGLLLFTDRIEKFVPPRKGRSHVLRLIRDLFYTIPVGKGTDIGIALSYCNRILNRKSIIILASDFQSIPYEKQIRITNRKHDLVNVFINDDLEFNLPDLGLLPLMDAETNHIQWVNTSSRAVREAYSRRKLRSKRKLNEQFKKYQIDTIEVETNQSFIEPMMSFFQRRANRL